MADTRQPEGPSEPDEAARQAIGVRVLVVLAVTVTVLMIVFGRATAEGYDEFDAYQSATLKDPDNPPRWQTEALDVDGCVDEVLTWIEDCPGVSSWCEGSLYDVMGQCLDSQDRTAYCESVGDTVLSTRFGYEECAARYDKIEQHHIRRYAKKHCAAIYRIIAGHCLPTGG